MDAPIVLSHKTAWLYYQASGMGALNENRDIPALTPAQKPPGPSPNPFGRRSQHAELTRTN